MEKKFIIPSASGNKRKIVISNQDDECAPDSEFKQEIPKMKVVKTETASDIEILGDGEEITLTESVFSNDLLLEGIFKHCTFEDLKSHRQVNRLWNMEATKAILNRFSMKPIELTCSSASRKFSISLNEFQFLVDKTTKFPCDSFYIRENLGVRENLLNFLKIHGNLIRSLVFKSSGASFSLWSDELNDFIVVNRGTTSRDLIQLLADYLPNLEILILPTSPNDDPSSYTETAKELTNLHTLKLSEYEISEELLSLLLNRSKNLKHIYVTNDSSLANLVKLNAVHLLNDIRFIISGDFIRLYDEALTRQLRCKEINVTWGKMHSSKVSEADLPKVGRILSEVFHKCSGTLQTVSLEIPLGVVPELRFATCPKVTRLLANCKCPSGLPIDIPLLLLVPHPFPWDFNLGITFPNLREFELFFDYSGDLPLFPESSIPLLSVRVLKFKRSYVTKKLPIPTEWLQQFCQLFPNISTADFGVILDSDFGLISTFRLLERLKFIIVVEETDEAFVRVDSLLTGFSRATVQRIYRQSEADFNLNVEDVENLRVTGSVADLKNLTKLTIEIIYPACYATSKEKYDEHMNEFAVRSDLHFDPVLRRGHNVIISRVARKFCLNMCPKLGSNLVLKSRISITSGFS